MAADRKHQGTAGHRVLDDAAVEAEHGPYVLLGQHLGRGARRVQPSVGEGDEVVRVPGGEVEVVQHHHDRGAARAVEVGQQVEDFDLVAGVQEGGGFVQQQQIGLLGQGHGDPHPLALPSGQFVDGAVGERFGVRRLQRGRHGGVVVGVPAGEDALVRVASPADQVRDGDALRGDRRLRQQAECAGEFLGGEAVHRLAVQDDPALAGRQQAGHRAQQRGLAAGVRADDHRDPAGRYGQVQRGDDRPVAVAQGETFGAESVVGGHSEPPARLVRMIR
ncbi:hypothetical protein EES43_01455 [Streptomyces sp. ADI96-02]|nr:hypothetical protein EES43_01455 [Streptomyces sp. ADI96-02]